MVIGHIYAFHSLHYCAKFSPLLRHSPLQLAAAIRRSSSIAAVRRSSSVVVARSRFTTTVVATSLLFGSHLTFDFQHRHSPYLGVCKLQRCAAFHLQMAAFVFSKSFGFSMPWLWHGV
ncbi:uncharacterized protein LOC125206803 [Salvia hispanica]|uniref:uncharacterized protein LOC125206803 n=1 Tax=Salvia hispanica TaxID=49212 RepID=UPI0020094701|nr:uncharacterized protein LOC125206803 [Salvia hispanica]